MLHAAELVKPVAQNSNVVVVVSAMKGVTDKLLAIAQFLADRQNFRARVEAELVLRLHHDALRALGLEPARPRSRHARTRFARPRSASRGPRARNPSSPRPNSSTSSPRSANASARVSSPPRSNAPASPPFRSHRPTSSSPATRFATRSRISNKPSAAAAPC